MNENTKSWLKTLGPYAYATALAIGALFVCRLWNSHISDSIGEIQKRTFQNQHNIEQVQKVLHPT